MDRRRPRILFLDAYDSFSNNIVSLVTTVLDADVEILPIDSSHFSDGDDDGVGDVSADGQGEVHRDSSGSSSNSKEHLAQALRHYDAVICGPGPGSPGSARDVGLMRQVWALSAAVDGLLPALGICLGFQSLVLSSGGSIQKLQPTGLHGMIRAIDHQQRQQPYASKGNIFHDVLPFKATLYHSLHADIGQSTISEADWPAAKWRAPKHLPDVVPLAWAYEDRGNTERHGYVERILMGVRHRTKPFWGLQYHPESICTEAAGHQVIRNWFEEAKRWNRVNGRVIKSGGDSPYLMAGITRTLALHPAHTVSDTGSELQQNGTAHDYRSWVKDNSRLATLNLDYQCQSKVLDLPAHIAVPDIVELLQDTQPTTMTTTTYPSSASPPPKKEFIIFDSASAASTTNTNDSKIGPDVRGRYSIIALDVDEALKLQYTTGDRHVTVVTACATHDGIPTPETERERVELGPHETVWQFLGDFWARRELTAHLPELVLSSSPPPFLGGFMGYVTYELGLEGIDVQQQQQSRKGSRQQGDPRPDLCFAWVTKSIVVDHLEGTLRVQILAPNSATATSWVDSTLARLSGSAFWRGGLQQVDSTKCDRVDNNAADIAGQPTPPLTPTTTGSTKMTNTTSMTTTQIQTPDAAEYEAKVRRCQEFIASGDSYELCLTDQTLITTITTTTATSHNHNHNHKNKTNNSSSTQLKDSTSWALYRRLRTRQPAPFGSYIRLGGATLVSSSPERFLEFDGVRGWCSMRPMKGTVRKKCKDKRKESSTMKRNAYEGGGSVASKGEDEDKDEEGGEGEGVSTLEQAERLLRIPKEEAENLMIVDLVRHDLHGVCGAGGVSVPHLLKVEEYASVFQMVSIVEGRFPPSPSLLPSSSSYIRTTTDNGENPQRHGEMQNQKQKQKQERITGLDVLAASLPPGSMTGAPKKRSCELLLGIEEGRERSLYSGVVGYMDVAGRGDWSVTIRSLFRWDDETVTTRIVRDGDDGNGTGEEEEKMMMVHEEEVWHIGAGGAVTALSTPRGERDEMFTKLRGPLGVFEDERSST